MSDAAVQATTDQPKPAFGYELRDGRVISLTSGMAYSVERAEALLTVIVDGATRSVDPDEAMRWMRNATRLVLTIRQARMGALH